MSAPHIDYSMVMDVTRSWDRLKATGANYQEAVGEVIFLK